MKFFYSASTMGYGHGYKWHKEYNFPNFPRVTRTLTYDKKRGLPFAIIKHGDSVWNRVGLHNVGFFNWLLDYTFYDYSAKDLSNVIVSLAGYDDQIEEMITHIESARLHVAGIELNFSCPNIKSFNNNRVPETNIPLYLKLNHTQDPYEYDLNGVKGIRLNSVPTKFGGLSGKAAQQKNWEFIIKFIHEGLNVSGCSFVSKFDLIKLKDMGCTEIGIGSVIMINPRFVEILGELEN